VWKSAGFVYEWNGGSIQQIRVNPTLLASKAKTQKLHTNRLEFDCQKEMKGI
jgi:hypothetical protein